MFQVIVINQEGVPGKLSQEMNWEDAIKTVITWVQTEVVEATEQMQRWINLDGHWQFEDGGGVYIVQSEKV